MSMSVNGIGNEPINVDAAYTKSPSASAAKPAASTTTTPAKTQTEDKAAVYEPSAKKPVADKNTYTQNTALVNKLKADAEQKNESFRKLVESVISKQGSTYQNADSMWKFLASGKFTPGVSGQIQQRPAQLPPDYRAGRPEAPFPQKFHQEDKAAGRSDRRGAPYDIKGSMPAIKAWVRISATTSAGAWKSSLLHL